MNDPVLGWRVWHLNRGRLKSWAVDYFWSPGENVAMCLASHRTACSAPPGQHCQCGFWALSAPRQLMTRVGTMAEPPWHVMGLIEGWGTVARHGREGFRAERAALRCLFTDRPWSGSAFPRAPGRLAAWWRRTFGLTVPPPPEVGSEPKYIDELATVAARYAVPLVSLRAAAGLGLLSELGVPRAQIEEAAGLVAAAADW